jgi:hypothetical protein
LIANLVDLDDFQQEPIGWSSHVVAVEIGMQFCTGMGLSASRNKIEFEFETLIHQGRNLAAQIGIAYYQIAKKFFDVGKNPWNEDEDNLSSVNK